jgi:16S rRNA (adenine1518-N6/adenine1519-N6)-dimethyltransferase
MADLCGAAKDVGVLEIGPGIGVLTQELSLRAAKVVSLEIDGRLLPILRETLADCDNTAILHADVMKTDLFSVLQEHFKGLRVVVCANLPYYITTPILTRLLEQRLPIESITVLVQKEAAERLCAPLGTRACGAVSAVVQYYSVASRLFSVSAGSFMPPPKVESQAIRLDIRQTLPVFPTDVSFMFTVIRGAFEQRRKTIANALASALAMSKQEVFFALHEADIHPMQRAEQLTLAQFSRLSDCLYKLRDESQPDGL